MVSCLFSLGGWDSNNINATVRWTVAREGLTERNLNFRQRRKCKRVPYPPLHETENHFTGAAGS